MAVEKYDELLRKNESKRLKQLFTGLLLGTAVGDAIGLPREGLSRRRAMRVFGGAPLRHRLVLGRGMVSDDTEHACMTGQALLVSGGEPERFARSLAWRLRGWLVALPAGVGMATARAVIKLWCGFPPDRSGVWSAGNGPAMRAPILGLYAKDDLELLRRLVRASTRLTHSDPAAEQGALAVALAAAYAAKLGSNEPIDPVQFLEALRPDLGSTPIFALIESVVRDAVTEKELNDHLAATGLERGVSGYINHTVPAALFCWLRWPRDFRTAVEQVILAGGDTDTTGAVVGALVGLTAGPQAIPTNWVDRLIEWPRGVRWMKQLATALADTRQTPTARSKPVPLFWPGLLLRNVFFLLVVLVHGVRRLLPPY